VERAGKNDMPGITRHKHVRFCGTSILKCLPQALERR
jgi:hypothetical protein